MISDYTMLAKLDTFFGPLALPLGYHFSRSEWDSNPYPAVGMFIKLLVSKLIRISRTFPSQIRHNSSLMRFMLTSSFGIAPNFHLHGLSKLVGTERVELSLIQLYANCFEDRYDIHFHHEGILNLSHTQTTTHNDDDLRQFEYRYNS